MKITAFLALSVAVLHGVVAAQPFQLYIYDIEQVLTSACPADTVNAPTPIPDGTPILFYWDINANGPDPDDPEGGCWGQAVMNGEALGLGAGLFVLQSAVICDSLLSSPHFYTCVSYGHARWTSEVFTVVSEVQEIGLANWACENTDTTQSTQRGGLSFAPQPDLASLHQNFPNPFNPTTQITFDLVEQTHVNLTVFNINGRAVATLVNGTVESGRHTVTFDSRHLPSGLYFYTAKIGNGFTSTKKMLLLK